MAPFQPTPAQLALIKKVNLEVNDDPRWVGKEGFCVPVMVEKLERLQADGIPEGAMVPVVVDAGPRYANEAHSLLRIEGEINGQPWSVYLDINQPWPLTPKDIQELGYTFPA